MSNDPTPPISNLRYYCLDGDKIGERLQHFLISNDLPSAIAFSIMFESFCEQVRRYMEENGAELKFEGGDSLIFIGPAELKIEGLPISDHEITFSVGIGSSLQLACMALFKAKALGRNRTCEM
jgi:minimal CRISPR polymerase domain